VGDWEYGNMGIWEILEIMRRIKNCDSSESSFMVYVVLLVMVSMFISYVSKYGTYKIGMETSKTIDTTSIGNFIKFEDRVIGRSGYVDGESFDSMVRCDSP
jgi:hypothetical protein